MIRTKSGNQPVTIRRYKGDVSPSLFFVTVQADDGGACFCVVHRCDLIDDQKGQEINNRIAELECLAEEGAT